MSTPPTEYAPPLPLLYYWLGDLTCKVVPEMTYNVLSGLLNPTIPVTCRVFELYAARVMCCVALAAQVHPPFSARSTCIRSREGIIIIIIVVIDL